eukprot:3519804-Prymnesium_polylepis.1
MRWAGPARLRLLPPPLRRTRHRRPHSHVCGASARCVERREGAWAQGMQPYIYSLTTGGNSVTTGGRQIEARPVGRRPKYRAILAPHAHHVRRAFPYTSKPRVGHPYLRTDGDAPRPAA